MIKDSPLVVSGTVRAKVGRGRPTRKKNQAIGSVHRALRYATRNDHAAIDQMLLPFNLTVADDYRAFLTIHLTALLTHREIWRAEDCADFECMRCCLRTDLERLGMPGTASLVLPCGETGAGRALGVAYVIRSSRLGAAVLRRDVPSTQPTSYLGYVPELTWGAFLGQLQAIADDQSLVEQAIGAAHDAFAAFASGFSRFQVAAGSGY